MSKRRSPMFMEHFFFDAVIPLLNVIATVPMVGAGICEGD